MTELQKTELPEKSVLEEQLESLEHALLLKRAYAAVKFNFGKGYHKAFPEEVVQEVERSLRSYAMKLATGIKASIKEEEQLSPEELSTLKLLAARVLEKTKITQDETLSNGQPKLVAQPDPNNDSLVVKLMTKENLSSDVKKRVMSQALLTIMRRQGSSLWVHDEYGNNFWVSEEDVSFDK